MRKLSIISLGLVLGLSTGCASIFGDNNDQISIRSNDPQATLQVNGNNVGTGSAIYSVPHGQTTLITATKPGCEPRSVATSQTIRGATWLDIFFWPTFLIDAATGAMHKTDPDNYTVTPECPKKA